MVDDGVYKIKDGVGYDVYFNGKLVGWTRTAQEGNKLYNEWEEAEARKRQKQAIENETKMADDNPRQSEGQNTGNEATGRGGSSILPPTIVLHMSKGSFWAWVFFLLVGLAILWYFTGWKIYIFWIIVGLGILWILIGIGATASAISKGRDYATFFWITCALIIWALDMVPANFPVLGQLLGEPWAGFEWYGGIFDISWGSIITSSLVFALLYVNMVYNIVKKEIWSFILAFSTILILNNLIARFFPNTLGLNFPVPYASWSFVLFLIFVIGGFVLALYLDKRLRSEIPNFFTYLFMIFVFSFFWVNTGWTNNWRAVLHAIFIIGFGFEYIRPKERQNSAVWHIAIPSLLILDFFGYGALFSSDYLWLKFIPVLVLSVIMYCYSKTENWYAMMSLVIIVTIILILSLQITAYEGGTFQFKQRAGGADFKGFFGTLGSKITDIVQQRLDIATAGLYRGNVEKNRYESLGVYFANVRAADPQFYTDEPITVWGSIRSKTYKDAVIINFSCYRLKDSKRIRADRIIPDIKFPIFTLEEVDTECTFLPKDKNSPDAIKSGANIITLSAEYNFGTDAYLKAYFIDRDRYRAYARENIDPFKEFGIKDTSPASVYTNGPVEIGIGTGQSLITVSRGYAVKPFIGVTLTNRKEIQDKDKRVITRWEGKIKNITELVLLVPPGVKLENDDGADSLQRYCKSRTAEEYAKCPCNMPFYEYKPEDCKDACYKNVYIQCQAACIGAYKTDPSDETGSMNKAQNDCIQECVTSKNNCENECGLLFSTSGDNLQGSYKGYALDVGSLQFKDLNKDIDKHRSFQCRFDPSPNVLDNNPITTRYFRVRARYNYLLENSVSVAVTEPLQPVLSTAPSDITKLSTEIGPGHALWFDGFSTDLISAISLVETQWRHCCAESGKNKASSCKPSEDTSCGADRILTSYAASKAGYYSIGMMQVQANPANQELAKPPICKPGQTIYDKECNILVGIKILKDNYEKYKNGISAKTLEQFCPQNQYPDRYAKYIKYRNDYAAIRAYNGWGCRPEAGCQKACENSKNPPACIQNCVDGTVSYVEKVKDKASGIKGGTIVDKSGIQGILASEDVQSVRDEAEAYYQKPSPPGNIQAKQNEGTPMTITISWTKSSSANVASYSVSRDSDGEPIRNVCDKTKEDVSCVDSTGDLISGRKYRYFVTAYDNNGEYGEGAYEILIV